MTLKISEIFYSIQGESTYSGLPTVFVRTYGCNLRCHYCDTKFSYTDETASCDMSPQNILDKINSYPHINILQITGGEPLLQEDIYDLFSLLNKNNFTILLETNGSISVKNVPDYVCKVVDIKTPSSGFPDSFVISNLNHINPIKDNLKFVLSDINDYNWMKDFIKKHNIYGQHVLISTAFSLINPKIIINKILEDGLNVRFQLQLHKYTDIK